LFGERGVGKTSLARVLANGLSINNKRIVAASINCDGTMTFSSLWHKIMREITVSFARPGMGFTGEPSVVGTPLNEQLPAEVTPDDVRHVLARVGKTLIIIDEVDRLVD